MERYGVTELKAGEICIVRPPFAAMPKEKPEPAQDRDDFRKLAAMSPDQQDRALQLGGLGPTGSQ
jgi:hypothetical protein